MWEDLDKLPWASLAHNYGRAEDVPELLRACAQSDVERAAEAWGALDNLLYHQGGWVCSAATGALPFLLDLAERRATVCRHDVVDLLFRLAEVGATAEPRFVDPGWPSAIAAVRPRTLALLADEDPQVRRKAILLVLASKLPYDELWSAMRRRWQEEQDRVTRWDLVLAFGEIRAEHPSADEVEAELVGLLDDADLQLRFAAVQAMAAIEPDLPATHLTTLIDAVGDSEAVGWQHSAWIGPSAAAAIRTAARLLRGTPAAAAAFTIRVSEHLDVDQRVANLANLANAGLLLAEWRTLSDVMLPYLADGLHDTEPEIRYRAAHLLGCLGAAATRYADGLAGLSEDPAMRDSRAGIMVGDAAVWALARQGDSRSINGLIERLSSERLGFDTRSSHVGGHLSRAFFFHQPGIHETLIPLSDHADVLVEPVIARLRTTTDAGLIQSLCAVLAAWKPVTDPVLNALVPLLARDDVWPAAATALGNIGPPAAVAADALRHRAERQTRDPTAAWAWFKVSKDRHAADLLLQMITDEPRHTTVRRLADIAPHAEVVIPRLAKLGASSDTWLRVEAAHTHWRLSGNPHIAVSTLTDVIRPLTTATECLPAQRTAMRYLADVNAGDAEAKQVATAVLENPRRLAYFGSWRTFTEDEDLRQAAMKLLGQTQSPDMDI